MMASKGSSRGTTINHTMRSTSVQGIRPPTCYAFLSRSQGDGYPLHHLGADSGYRALGWPWASTLLRREGDRVFVDDVAAIYAQERHPRLDRDAVSKHVFLERSGAGRGGTAKGRRWHRGRQLRAPGVSLDPRLCLFGGFPRKTFWCCLNVDGLTS